MASILTEAVDGPVAWSGRDLAPDESWTYRLGAADVEDMEAALAVARGRRPIVEAVTREDFPLGTLGARLGRVGEQLETGRGMYVLRGIPAERWGALETARAMWGIGTYLGHAIPQNARGDLVGHVRDEGKVLSDPQARGYQTRAAQSLHVDRCDVVGLLCVNKARSGGISRVVSSVRVHNELLARAPWHLGMLYTPFAIDLRGEERAGEPPVYYRPIFSYHDGALSCGANATYIRSGQERVGRPLNAAQSEALDAFYETCEEHTLSMDLEPGDFQLLNSYVTLHDRTGYDDYDEPERKRHMLRLWLEVPNRRPLAPDFGTYDFAAGRVVGIR
ncbi:MAG: TauD/TfdA family dioxygenase [Candidatus Eremiobacteraeota bacterium]|nr:TauD/TfdA family dioxygenase [Candidatus Eremiobacteraeota bacterium]